MRKTDVKWHQSNIIKDLTFTILILAIATLIAFLFFKLVPSNSVNIALIYILALIQIAKKTEGFHYGLVASVFCVICVNYLFTYPFFEINFTLSGYPVTFIGMLSISLITSTSTSIVKKQSLMLAEREKIIAEAEKEKMRATLLRAVSHDLRTPLTCIISTAASYLEDNTSLSEKDKTELMEHIRDDADWLLHMVENLLTVTRIQETDQTVTKNPEIIEEVISEAIFRLRKRDPDAEINVTMPDNLLIVPMDAVLIEQVIINLLENAIHHANSKKAIDLIVDEDDTHIIFKVRDYGIGIDPQRLPNIFDANTTSTSSDSYKGMGIGLSICKSIINAHNGVISAANHKNGAEFTFQLPKEDTHES